MGQLLLLGLQAFQFAGHQLGLFQALPAALVVFLLIPGGCQPFFQLGQVAPVEKYLVPGFGAGFAQLRATRMQVQGLHPEAGVLQEQGLVLRMDIDQAGRQFLQHVHAHRLVVGEAAGASAAAYGAAKHQAVVFAGKVGIGQDAAHGLVHAELGLYHAILAGRPHHRGIGLGAQHQGQRPQQDGFSGAGLSAYNDEALRKTGFQRADQNVIADGETVKHSLTLR